MPGEAERAIWPALTIILWTCIRHDDIIVAWLAEVILATNTDEESDRAALHALPVDVLATMLSAVSLARRRRGRGRV